MGRIPIPTEIHKQRGSKDVKYRRKNEIEPERVHPEGLPPAPEWMTTDSRIHWQTFGHELARMGLFTRLDQLSLALLCEKLALICAAKTKLTENGRWDIDAMVVSTESGGSYQCPELGIYNKAWDGIIKLCQQYGMTPSSRVGLSVDPKTGEIVNAKAKFFKGPK